MFVDVDDTIIEVHGHQKQGDGFGYSVFYGHPSISAAITAGADVSVTARMTTTIANDA